jgi:hypothetical protein
MDWITFIKWNGIVYASYYGANLLVDYLHTKREFSPKTNYTQYQLKDLGIEEPKVIKSSDFPQADSKQEDRSNNENAESSRENDNQMTFNAPIERQGMPIKEFLKNSHLFSAQIFKPTI